MTSPSKGAVTNIPDGHVTDAETTQIYAQQVIGPFSDAAPHAKGGLGEVFRATDPALHRTVAVKRLQARLEYGAEYGAIHLLTKFWRAYIRLIALNSQAFAGCLCGMAWFARQAEAQIQWRDTANEETVFRPIQPSSIPNGARASVHRSKRSAVPATFHTLKRLHRFDKARIG